MSTGLDIAFFGSSLVSAYWNGAATYYRGIVRALHERGHRVTFYEPDAYDRQQHRDIADPDWATVVVYPGEGDEHGAGRGGARARRRPGGEGERRRRVRRAARARGARPAAARHAGGLLGRGRARHARPRRRRSGRSVPRRSSRATTWCSPTAAASRWCAAYTRLRRARVRADLQRARSRPRTTRCRRTRASPPTSASSATGCRTARRAWRSSSFAPPPQLPDGRFLLGGSGWGDKAMPAERALPGARLHGRPQRLQLHAAQRC